MPSSRRTQTELLALAASQLERATAATTALLDRNDEKLHDLGVRASVIEAHLAAAEARLKQVELIVGGTLSEKGLKERFHYTEAELRRIQHYLSSIDSRFTIDVPKSEKSLFWDWGNPNFVVVSSATMTAVLIVAGMLLWKYILLGLL